MSVYDHKKIEKKWQEEWARTGIYTTPDSVPGIDNFYLLVEFPYPSGNLHVGHWYAFAVPDILARAMRMQGKNVMYPIGFDAFGLPAENAAIKNKLNPRDWTEQNIAYMTKQIESMGTSFDWSRKVSTIDPAYYKWTQWLFIQLYKKGLVYQKETAVNWCPKDMTVLANEQVVDGKCERCGSDVAQRQMLQWNIKITEYADRLIDDLDTLDWPSQIKESQKNWIGRSEGAEIDFALDIDSMEHVVLLHGKGGKPDGDFMLWAKEQLEMRGYSVEIPALPNTSEPDDVEQAAYIKQNCRIDSKTIIVGHSAGGLAALRLLETETAGRLVLVATPHSGTFLDGKERPSVARSIERGYKFDAIQKNVSGGVLALYDETDTIVPLTDGELFAKELDGIFIKARATKSHFNAEKEPDVLMVATPTIRVFTTRPDTLFGATYLVLAPEHPWVTLALGHKTVLKNNDEVQKYVTASAKKSDLERQADQRDKTGVLLEGVDAINPATGEKIPMYVADYVLGHYGTGAIMAVPAHDERDFEFAKKFDLPIRQVVLPVFGSENKRPDAVHRATVSAIVRNAKGEILLLRWADYQWLTGVIGGIEEGEAAHKAAEREVLEETGYKTRAISVSSLQIESHFYADHKKEWRSRIDTPVLLELVDEIPAEISAEESAKHTVEWVRADAAIASGMFGNNKLALEFALGRTTAYVDPQFGEEQVLVNSGEFNGVSIEEAKKVMAERYGRVKKTYRLRDWIVSRQRYWGVPIPMVHCAACGAQPVADEQLPVELPAVDDYLPDGSGKSPLAKVDSFVNTICPKCGGAAQRETDTLDTFVDSSWYFLRYADAQNASEFASRAKQDSWMPIDLYSGGAEHTTMHLLYSRFWQKALFDIGLVGDSEPYTHRENHGLVLGTDGQKMSKSKGNVLDPDAVVEQVGSDTVRMYLAFMGPYTGGASYPWNPNGVVGVRRFLERVWRLNEKFADGEGCEAALHRAIKKVSEDVAKLKFNTAVSALMILVNEAEKTGITKDQFGRLLRLVAPFAPHMSEELWHSLGNTSSIHLESWPSYEEKYLVDDTVTIAIQIDGKTRGEVSVPADADKASTEAAAREAMTSRLEGQNVARVVVVPKRLVNFVLEK